MRLFQKIKGGKLLGEYCGLTIKKILGDYLAWRTWSLRRRGENINGHIHNKKNFGWQGHSSKRHVDNQRTVLKTWSADIKFELLGETPMPTRLVRPARPKPSFW